VGVLINGYRHLKILHGYLKIHRSLLGKEKPNARRVMCEKQIRLTDPPARNRKKATANHSQTSHNNIVAMMRYEKPGYDSGITQCSQSVRTEFRPSWGTNVRMLLLPVARVQFPTTAEYFKGFSPG